MSRTRLLRPGFFADEELSTKLSRDSRLAYAGLWTECDDAGYFEAKPRQLARAIFGYDDDGLEVVETALRDLVALEKVQLFDCGLHGLVPSLPLYAQQGGNKTFGFRAAHESRCTSELVRTRPVLVPTTPPADPVRTDTEQVQTHPPAGVVRTRTDKSRSESVSVLESGTTKKNVLEGVVEETNEAREPSAFEVDPDPFLSDPVRLGRPRASTESAPPLTVPPALAAVTPQWRHVCTDFVRHQSKHRIVDGVAQCDTCEEVIAAAGSGAVNGAEIPQKGLGL